MSGFWFGVQVAVVGIAIVLGALIILAVLTSLLSKLTDKANNDSSSKENLNNNSFNLQEDSEDKEIIQTNNDTINYTDYNEHNNINLEELDPVLMAVISAAVAESFGHTVKYRITAVRKETREKAPVWNQVGRMEQINSIIN